MTDRDLIIEKLALLGDIHPDQPLGELLALRVLANTRSLVSSSDAALSDMLSVAIARAAFGEDQIIASEKLGRLRRSTLFKIGYRYGLTMKEYHDMDYVQLVNYVARKVGDDG